uniref:MHC class II beta chain N-terminal domain-containing protein n=1 Tax=Terrapene triunguis TaxID=2587831 RepID=A0A674J0W7_9SAUR
MRGGLGPTHPGKSGAGCVGLCLSSMSSGSPCRGGGGSQHFLLQSKHDCLYTNGTERVRFLHRYIWDRQPFLHFDSEVGRFVADTELGRPDAEGWNKDPAILADARAAVDRCRHNYGAVEPF